LALTPGSSSRIGGEIFVNLVLTARSEFSRSIQEGCLSFPGRLGVMTRYATVEIGGRPYVNDKAIVIQHELDHLNGITIV